MFSYLLYSLSSSLFIHLIIFIFLVLTSRVVTKIWVLDSFIYYYLLIIMIGGLIISFTYIIRIYPNWVERKRGFYLSLTLRLILGFNLYLTQEIPTDLIISSFILCSNQINLALIGLLLTLIFLLIWILVVVDYMFIEFKGYAQNP